MILVACNSVSSDAQTARVSFCQQSHKYVIRIESLIERRQIPSAMGQLLVNADGPDFLEFERSLLANQVDLVPRGVRA